MTKPGDAKSTRANNPVLPGAVAGQEMKRLSDMTQQVGFQSGMSVRVAILFGLPFFGMGAMITLVGLEIIPVDPRSVHAPMWVLTVVGLVFASAGLIIWNMAWKQTRMEARLRASQRQNPNEPACADYPWDREGFSPPRWSPILGAWGMILFLIVFMSCFNWWAFFSGEGPLMVKILVGLFDLILIWSVWHSLKVTIHAFKFGRTRLIYSQFPLKIGDWFQAEVTLPAGIERVAKAVLELRCVCEFYETTGSGRNRSKRLVHQQLWSESQELSSTDIGAWPRSLKATFAIPPDGPASRLSGHPTIFWELVVTASVPGVDFKQKYLVPVY